MRIDFLLVETYIEKYSTKIGVEKFRNAPHWSCLEIVVKTFENTKKGITKIMIFLKDILTTKCKLKLNSKESLVCYGYSALSAWHLNLLCHFQRKLHQNFTKLINLAKINILPSEGKRENIKRPYIVFELKISLWPFSDIHQCSWFSILKQI